MNGRLDKVAMTNKLMQLKRELHYKCEIGEKNEGYCTGANDYLNRTFEILYLGRESQGCRLWYLIPMC